MNDDVLEEAARWHAVQQREDMDWDAFTAWLEADPRHPRAFDEMALLDDDVARHREALRATVGMPGASAPPAASRRHVARWPRIAGGVAAAVAILGVGVATLRRPGGEAMAPAAYRAGAASRVLHLKGDVLVSLAAGSVLTVEGGAAGRLSIVGRALFDVRHDPGRRLTVMASGYRIEDIGTRFDVVTGGGMMKVAVADGRVRVASSSGAAGVTIAAGRSLTGLAGGQVTVTAIGAGRVGEWRAGPLVYDGVPLGLVAADVARASGRAVGVDPAIAARPFSGVLSAARGDAMVEALGSIAGLRSGRVGDAVVLRDRAPR